VLDSDAALAERLEVCGMVGRSPAMREMFSVINRLAPHARTVLVTGETGTGKELVARALHHLGPRKAKKLVTVNCSAVVETLFESELFGHVRGAFTGAVADKAGVFESANGGTVFLDEVGELRLVHRSWPGNVRELRNVIERSCLLCEGHLLTEGDLARSLAERPSAPAPPEDERKGPPPSPFEVQAAMDSTGGTKTLAAQRLGISRRKLYRLIDKYVAAASPS